MLQASPAVIAVTLSSVAGKNVITISGSLTNGSQNLPTALFSIFCMMTHLTRVSGGLFDPIETRNNIRGYDSFVTLFSKIWNRRIANSFYCNWAPSPASAVCGILLGNTMKECPKCRTVYTDKTLSFCLSDGSVLIEEPTGAKTEVLPGGLVSQTVETQTSSKTQNSNLITDETIIRTARSPKGAGVSPFWLLSTFALLGIILAGAVVAWVLYSRSGDEQASQTGKSISVAKTSNSSSSNDANENESETATNSADVTPTTSNTPSPSPTRSATPAEKTYKVIGVKSGDVLYMRPSPGNLKVVVGKIPPGAAGIRVVGKGRRAGKSIWVPIVYNGKRGWVNRRFLSTSK